MLANQPIVNKKKGFTLLELLVVIAIIGVLASVTLAALNGARTSASNKAILQQMNEYEKALDLYFAENGLYPTGHSSANMTANGARSRVSCVGDDYSGGACVPSGGFGVFNVYNSDTNTTFETGLTPYISSQPRFEAGQNGWSSPAYSGCNVTGNNCQTGEFSLYYFLEGAGEDCGRGTDYNHPNATLADLTLCVLSHGN